MRARPRRRALWSGLALLVLALVAWLWRVTAAADGAPSGAAGAMAPVSAVANGSQPEIRGRAASATTAAAASPPAAGPASAPSSAAALAPVDDFEIPPEGLELCGVGRVTPLEIRAWKAIPALGRAALERYEVEMNRRTDAMLPRVAARLSVGTEREQVAARLLMDDPHGAAALALGSGDPVAYRLALQGCARAATVPGAAGCGQLNARRWAALDPTDARPWLALLAQAHSRGDAAAVDAALAEAAARPRLSGNSFVLEAQVARVLALETDPLSRALMVVRVVGIDAATSGHEVFSLSTVCREPARQPVCRTVARQALAAADTLSEATLAQSIAERLGVPPGEQAHDRATLQAALNAYADFSTKVGGFDCAAMGDIADYSIRRVEQGELHLALSLLASRQSR